MLTGYTTTVVSGRTQISQGNPDLKPERSLSFDAGAEWTSRATRLDFTLFRTVVKDRFISNVVISNPAPPEPIVAIGVQRARRPYQRRGLRGGASPRQSRRGVREHDALLQSQGASGQRSGAGHPERGQEYGSIGCRRGLRAAQRPRIGPLRPGTEGQQLQRTGIPDRRLRRLHGHRCDDDLPAASDRTRSDWRSTTCWTRSTTKSSAFRCRAHPSG